MNSFISGTKRIDVEIFSPTGPGEHPAIVISYGTHGMNDPFGDGIRRFANALAADGFLVAIPHYFMRTGDTGGTQPDEDIAISLKFATAGDDWIDTVQDCIKHVAARSDVDSDRIGLLGFSMGGYISIRLAKRDTTPKIKALVEFFAPVSLLPTKHNIDDNIDRITPVLIHHGEDDGIVPLSQSLILVQALESAGKTTPADYRFITYPGEGHGFTSPSAIADSTSDTIDFFKEKLR